MLIKEKQPNVLTQEEIEAHLRQIADAIHEEAATIEKASQQHPSLNFTFHGPGECQEVIR
jgi:hypothetical protein